MRAKPDHHKRRIALGVSLALTSIIFVVWLSVVSQEGQPQVITSKPKEDTPITTLKKGAASVYGAFREALSSSKSINLQSEYEKMKQQVESGEIKLVPESQ